MTQKHAGNAPCGLAGKPVSTVCSPRSKGQSAFGDACKLQGTAPWREMGARAARPPHSQTAAASCPARGGCPGTAGEQSVQSILRGEGLRHLPASPRALWQTSAGTARGTSTGLPSVRNVYYSRDRIFYFFQGKVHPAARQVTVLTSPVQDL